MRWETEEGGEEPTAISEIKAYVKFAAEWTHFPALHSCTSRLTQIFKCLQMGYFNALWLYILHNSLSVCCAAHTLCTFTG